MAYARNLRTVFTFSGILGEEMTKLGEVCKHGSLRRQCEMCDLVDALEIERRTSERNRVMCGTMEQDLAAAQAELAKFAPLDGNRDNTSLANWFPLSAEELAAAREESEGRLEMLQDSQRRRVEHEDRIGELTRELAAANDECQRSFAREATAKAELQRREKRKVPQGFDRRQSAQEVWNVLRTQLADAKAELKLNAHMLAQQCDMARQAEIDLAAARAECDALRSQINLPDDYCLSCGGIGGHDEGCRGTTGLIALEAERNALRADAARFVWYFTDGKGADFLSAYRTGLHKGWSLDQWRAEIDKARSET
jgi:hypothetical protein